MSDEKQLTTDELAKLCIAQAWTNDCDDTSRQLLELASRELRKLARRCIRLAHNLEQEEARNAS